MSRALTLLGHAPGMTCAASLRREHHQHLAAFHARMLLDLGGLRNVGLDPLEERLIARCRWFREAPETLRGVVGFDWAAALNQ